MTDTPQLLSDIHALLARGSRDELRAFLVIARRVMGGGRKQYGPLILSNDTRDFKREAADEAADLVWYVAIQQVLDGEFDDEEPTNVLPQSGGGLPAETAGSTAGSELFECAHIHRFMDGQCSDCLARSPLTDFLDSESERGR